MPRQLPLHWFLHCIILLISLSFHYCSRLRRPIFAIDISSFSFTAFRQLSADTPLRLFFSPFHSFHSFHFHAITLSFRYFFRHIDFAFAISFAISDDAAISLPSIFRFHSFFWCHSPLIYCHYDFRRVSADVIFISFTLISFRYFAAHAIFHTMPLSRHWHAAFSFLSAIFDFLLSLRLHCFRCFRHPDFPPFSLSEISHFIYFHFHFFIVAAFADIFSSPFLLWFQAAESSFRFSASLLRISFADFHFSFLFIDAIQSS